jgi:hypothetical protein
MLDEPIITINTGGLVSPMPFPGNPDTRPGAWPGLVAPGGVIQANGGPAQVPIQNPPAVVVTPTSGPIPPPQVLAAAAAPAPASWMDQTMISGVPNK